MKPWRLLASGANVYNYSPIPRFYFKVVRVPNKLSLRARVDSLRRTVWRSRADPIFCAV